VVHAIAEGVWQVHVPGRTLPPYAGTECYFLGLGGRVWLVDAGDGEAAARAALEAAWDRLGRPKVEGILITHHHRDHVGGAAWAAARFAAPVYLSAAELALLAKAAPSIGLPEPDWVALPPGPRSLAGVEAEIVLAPGHTPGQLNVWLPEAGLLLAGDNVLGSTTSVVTPPHGNLRQYQQTLRRLLALAPPRIGPGHGPLVEGGVDRLRQYLEHRQRREEEILRRLRMSPATAAELAEALYREQLPPARLHVGERMVRGHLDPLLQEGKVAIDAEGRYRAVAP
jgi:ribonuclease/clavin/mitogillin